jgi:hypothetical protein
VTGLFIVKGQQEEVTLLHTIEPWLRFDE